MRRTCFTKSQLIEEIVAQRRWIAEHGSTLAGYVARYGRASDPTHFGSGGEAIYRADANRLTELEQRLEGWR